MGTPPFGHKNCYTYALTPWQSIMNQFDQGLMNVNMYSDVLRQKGRAMASETVLNILCIIQFSFVLWLQPRHRFCYEMGRNFFATASADFSWDDYTTLFDTCQAYF